MRRCLLVFVVLLLVGAPVVEAKGGSSSSSSSSSGRSSSSSSSSSKSSSGSSSSSSSAKTPSQRASSLPSKQPSGTKVPPGRSYSRDYNTIRRNPNYFNPAHPLYYGRRSSPFYYIYLGTHQDCDEEDLAEGDPDCGEKDSKCGSGVFLPLPFAAGALAWRRNRRRKKHGSV